MESWNGLSANNVNFLARHKPSNWSKIVFLQKVLFSWFAANESQRFFKGNRPQFFKSTKRQDTKKKKHIQHIWSTRFDWDVYDQLLVVTTIFDPFCFLLCLSCSSSYLSLLLFVNSVSPFKLHKLINTKWDVGSECSFLLKICLSLKDDTSNEIRVNHCKPYSRVQFGNINNENWRLAGQAGKHSRDIG